MTNGILYNEELSAARCMAPGCTHDHHDDPRIVLVQNCHPLAGTKTSVTEGEDGWILTVRCAFCNALIVNVAVSDEDFETENTCHTEAPLMIEYSAGEIVIHCGQCVEIIDSIPVRERDKKERSK